MEIDTTLQSVQNFLADTENIDELFGGSTLACHCIENGNNDSLQLLIDSGCDTTGLLHYSISSDKKDAFEILIKNKVDINQLNNGNFPPINFASKQQASHYVLRLLEEGADPSFIDDDGFSPLIYAVRSDNFEIAEQLLQKCAPTSTIGHQDNALREAILQRNTPMAYLLIRYGANPNLLDDSNVSLLKLSVEQECPDIFKLLIATGANVTELDGTKIPSDYETIKNEWCCTKNEKTEFAINSNTIIKSLRMEFDALKNKTEQTIAKTTEFDFENGYITPMLNNYSSVIVSLANYIKRLEKYNQYFTETKNKYLDTILMTLSRPEYKSIEDQFNEDERQWYQLIEKTREINITLPGSIDYKAAQSLTKIAKSFTKLRDSVCEPAGRIFPDDLPEIKSNLCFANKCVASITYIVFELYHLMQKFLPAFNLLLRLARQSLNALLDTLMEVRQTCYEIRAEGSNEKDKKVEDDCTVQCDKVMVDLSIINWKQESLDELGRQMMQCLRMMVM